MIYIFILSYELIKNKSQCDKWDITLNNTNINKVNSKSECKIILPKTCLMKSYYGLFDMSSFMGFNCNNFDYKQARTTLLKKLNKTKFKKTLRFGYINTINIDFYHKNIKIFNEIVLNRTIDMDNITEVNELKANEYPEVILEYTNSNYKYAKIKMNITKKKELSEYRKKKRK